MTLVDLSISTHDIDDVPNERNLPKVWPRGKKRPLKPDGKNKFVGKKGDENESIVDDVVGYDKVSGAFLIQFFWWLYPEWTIIYPNEWTDPELKRKASFLRNSVKAKRCIFDFELNTGEGFRLPLSNYSESSSMQKLSDHDLSTISSFDSSSIDEPLNQLENTNESVANESEAQFTEQLNHLGNTNEPVAQFTEQLNHLGNTNEPVVDMGSSLTPHELTLGAKVESLETQVDILSSSVSFLLDQLT